MIDLLVLGLGNVLCTDDGAGVAALEALADAFEPPDGVSFVDGGTLGLGLLPLVRSARHVLMLDAVAADQPAGTLVRVEGDDVGPAVSQRLSVHQVGVADLVGVLRLVGGACDGMSLLGVVPASIELGVEPTPAVRAAIPELVRAAADECAARGHPLIPRGATDVSWRAG